MFAVLLYNVNYKAVKTPGIYCGELSNECVAENFQL